MRVTKVRGVDVSRPSSQASPVPYADHEYGSFTTCPKCSQRADIWTDLCACGNELLPDDRKVKLAKSGGSPEARMSRRVVTLEQEGSDASLEQAVRDRAALRARRDDRGTPEAAHTPRIIADLISLNRVDEACAEAEGLAAADIPAVGTFAPLATRLVEEKDPRAEWWLRRTIELDARASFIDRGACDALVLKGTLVGMLIDQGCAVEALPLYETALADLQARLKKSSKSLAVQLAGGSGEAFASGRWGHITKALEEHRRPVLDANVAAAVTVARDALAEKDRLEALGDLAAAREVTREAGERTETMLKRLGTLASGLKLGDRRVVDPIKDVKRLLDAEYKRLKKLAKRS